MIKLIPPSSLGQCSFSNKPNLYFVSVAPLNCAAFINVSPEAARKTRMSSLYGCADKAKAASVYSRVIISIISRNERLNRSTARRRPLPLTCDCSYPELPESILPLRIPYFVPPSRNWLPILLDPSVGTHSCTLAIQRLSFCLTAWPT